MISKTVNGITVTLEVSATGPPDDITIRRDVIRGGTTHSTCYISLDVKQVDTFIT